MLERPHKIFHSGSILKLWNIKSIPIQ